MKFYSCWCGYRMPVQNERANAAHQQEHPTEEQLREAADRQALSLAVDAMDNRQPLGADDRMRAALAVLNAAPGVIFEELIQKPLRRQLDNDEASVRERRIARRK